MSKYATEKGYEAYSRFTSLKEFNSHFEQSMMLYKDTFTKSEYIALKKLRDFAGSDIIGVAWCKAQRAVAGTHKDTLTTNNETFGISRSTFDRMLRKAKRMNLVNVINQYNKQGKKIHNVYVFNRVENVVALPKVEAVKTVEIVSISNTIGEKNCMKIDFTRTSILLELPKLKDLNTYSQAKIVPVSKEIQNDSPKEKTEYQQLKELVEIVTEEKTLVYRMYGAWLGQTKKLINKPSFEIAIQAVKLLIAEIKKRANNGLPALYNAVGYFNGIVTKKINAVVESAVVEFEIDENEVPVVENANITDWLNPKEQEYTNPIISSERNWLNW